MVNLLVGHKKRGPEWPAKIRTESIGLGLFAKDKNKNQKRAMVDAECLSLIEPGRKC